MISLRNFLFIILLNLMCFNIKGQETKQKLGFIPYSNPDNDPSGYRDMAYNYLYESATRIFINTQRFEILDRSKFDILSLEKNYQKGDDFINSEIVAQGNSLAAEVLAVAKLTALSVTQDPEKGWLAFFTVELKQIDIETSKAVDAVQLKGQLKPGGNITLGSTIVPSGGHISSPEQAIAKAVEQMEDRLYDWIHESFPVKMIVLDFDASNKVIYVKGGKDIGLNLKDNMCLRRIRKLVTGDKVEETVAELKFTKTDGVGSSTTKFQPKKPKEWKKILEAIKNHPEEVFVMESAREPLIKVEGIKFGKK